MAKQARFWICYRSGAVRLKLNEGQTVDFSHGGQTDEGYSWTAERYSFDGKTVSCHWMVDARDCDGRETRSNSCRCSFKSLSAGYVDVEFKIAYPAWEHGESSQRDYSAEAAGY